MRSTLATYSPRSCALALRAAARMYGTLRTSLAPDAFVLRKEAEEAALLYLEEILMRAE
jgi:hypothetical protein